MARKDELDDTVVVPEQKSEALAHVNLRPKILREVRNAIAAQQLNKAAANYLCEALRGPHNGNRRGRIRFPSPRMGVSMEVLHGALGLAALEKIESDKTVVAYIERPAPLKVWIEVKGRRRAILMGPEILVMRSHQATVIFLVPDLSLAGSSSNTFQFVDGRWICPGAEKALAELQLCHEVWTDSTFSRTEISNRRLLLDYYRQEEISTEEQSACDAVRAKVTELGAPTISELLVELKEIATIDDVFRAIALRCVYADLVHGDLSRHEEVRLTSSEAQYLALTNCHTFDSGVNGRRTPEGLVQIGDDICWDGVIRHVSHIGDKYIELKTADDRVSEFPLDKFQQYLTDGKILRLDVAQNDERFESSDVHQALLQTPREYLDIANERFDRIEPYLSGQKKSPNRTLRRWLSAFRHSQIRLGNGYLGLIPKFKLCGNQARRLSNATLELVEKIFKQHYADPRNWSCMAAHGALRVACAARGIYCPSYSWFCRHVESKSPYELKLAREGAKAAYSLKPRDTGDRQTSMEAVRVFERGHIDHTQIDLETVYGPTGESLGRPWLTVLLDEHSRVVLAYYLCYDPPSYRSVLMTLRACVRRHSRLPDLLVVDGGKEFRSTWFQTICAYYWITIQYRRPAHPRDGSVGERSFGTLNTMLFHRLQGNTQVTRNVRQMTSEVDPRNHAVWTLPALVQLLNDFIYEEYEKQVHSTLLMSPRQAFNLSLERSGRRLQRHIFYTEAFRIMTCPGTDKGTALADANGVKVNNFVYYDLQLVDLIGKRIPIRYEPMDLSIVWGFIASRWVRLICRRWNHLLQGLSERDIEIASTLLKKRRTDVNAQRLSSKALATFIEQTQEDEFVLQRKRSEAVRLAYSTEQEAQPAPAAAANDAAVTDPDSEVASPLAGYERTPLKTREL